MIGIILYCLGVMYTPGPVNLLSLNQGVQSRFTKHIPFCAGVGGALCIWFLFVGYAGGAVMSDKAMPIISTLGAAFILYLAYKIIFSNVDGLLREKQGNTFTFYDGLLMQLLNPKSFLAVLPVTAVQFPAAGIEGGQIAVWSVGLGALGFGAPLVYTIMGAKVARHIEDTRYIKWLNCLMGAALVFVALDIAYTHVYLVLR